MVKNKILIDMARAGKNRSLKKALGELLSNYVSGRIPDRRWNWIMEVLDSGLLTRAQRLEYVIAINQNLPGRV